jgi:hypothetical protein
MTECANHALVQFNTRKAIVSNILWLWGMFMLILICAWLAIGPDLVPAVGPVPSLVALWLWLCSGTT